MQRVTTRLVIVAAIVGVLIATGAVAIAGFGGKNGFDRSGFRATLTGYEEVPAISTAARGRFKARLDRSGDRLHWRLTYQGIPTSVLQAHIHFGQRAVNGGVSVFLCSNLAGAPAGTQRCPATAGTISGTATATDVIGPADQGIAPGELGELAAAMLAGVTYVNVHSEAFPNGEIRGQINGKFRHRRR